MWSFIKFTDVINNKNAAIIADLSIRQPRWTEVLEKKLVAQNYNGAAVMGGNLNGVQAKIRETVPKTTFLHCYAQKLHLFYLNFFWNLLM